MPRTTHPKVCNEDVARDTDTGHAIREVRSMVYPLVKYVGPAYPAQPQGTRSTMPRELDTRQGDGICVRLLWHPDDGHVSVAVIDTKTGETFDLFIHDGE